jgi:hypothetical protein
MTSERDARCRKACVLIEAFTNNRRRERDANDTGPPGSMCDLVLKQLHDLHSLVDSGLS